MGVLFAERELFALVYEKVKRPEFSIVKPGGALIWVVVRGDACFSGSVDKYLLLLWFGNAVRVWRKLW